MEEGGGTGTFIDETQVNNLGTSSWGGPLEEQGVTTCFAMHDNSKFLATWGCCEMMKCPHWTGLWLWGQLFIFWAKLDAWSAARAKRCNGAGRLPKTGLSVSTSWGELLDLPQGVARCCSRVNQALTDLSTESSRNIRVDEGYCSSEIKDETVFSSLWNRTHHHADSQHPLNPLVQTQLRRYRSN